MTTKTTKAKRIHLSLVSHTNIGKTTLARTLLGRDIGEIADRAHVTETTDDYILAQNPEGDALVLWDTPGFGNSVALARSLENRKNPIGWFTSEVWDRVANRTQWLNQQVLKHVQKTSSVVLYLVNAADSPTATAYVEAEMRILTWIGKPVIVLLNQTGQPKEANDEALEIARWKIVKDDHPIVRSVLTMDAFARCWVQEFVLLDAIEEALPAEDLSLFETLRKDWTDRRMRSFSESILALSRFLEKLQGDTEFVPTPDLAHQVREIGERIRHLSPGAKSLAMIEAQNRLSERASIAICDLTDQLISANHLIGSGIREDILQRVREDWAMKKPVNPTGAALVGAIGSSALGGLAADIATGGLSLGLGALIGGAIGAIGGAGLAYAYNSKHESGKGTTLSWSDSALKNFALEATLLYLAVAHFGRGRGQWVKSEYPSFWRPMLEDCMAEKKPTRETLVAALDSGIRCVLAKMYPNTEF